MEQMEQLLPPFLLPSLPAIRQKPPIPLWVGSVQLRRSLVVIASLLLYLYMKFKKGNNIKIVIFSNTQYSTSVYGDLHEASTQSSLLHCFQVGIKCGLKVIVLIPYWNKSRHFTTVWLKNIFKKNKKIMGHEPQSPWCKHTLISITPSKHVHRTTACSLVYTPSF